MAVAQGDVYWVDFGEPVGSGPGFRRPGVVISNNAFNRSRINTVVVVSITTNLRLRAATGNVLLEPGEASLPAASVVNISQISTVDRMQLETFIGRVSPQRVNQILNGMRLMLWPS